MPTTLTNQALTTTSAVQGVIDTVTDEGKIARLINAVSEEMAAVAGNRVWYYSTTHTHKVKGRGSARIWVPAPPISAITSIILQDVAGTALNTYSSSDYGIEGDGTLGSIMHVSGWPVTALLTAGFARDADLNSIVPLIRVIYTGGWITPWQVDPKNSANLIATVGSTPTLPSDLEQACLDEVVSKLRGYGRDLTIETQTGEQSVTTYRRQPKTRGTLSERCYNVARRYWLGPQ